MTREGLCVRSWESWAAEYLERRRGVCCALDFLCEGQELRQAMRVVTGVAADAFVGSIRANTLSACCTHGQGRVPCTS